MVVLVVSTMCAVAAIIGVYAFQWRRAQKRMKALAAFARKVGIDFCGGEEGAFPDEFRISLLSQAGRGPAIHRLLEGLLGPGRISVFDLEFSRILLERLYQNYLTVCSFHTQWRFAALQVRPEGTTDKAAAVFGMNDMQLGDTEFDRRWHVLTSYEGFARAVLTEPVRQFFRERPGLNLEMYRRYFLLYYTGRFLGFVYARKMKAADVVQLVGDALALADLIENQMQRESPAAAS